MNDEETYFASVLAPVEGEGEGEDVEPNFECSETANGEYFTGDSRHGGYRRE